ncbi:hydrolase [Flavobacterium faecale]|uniref:Hydrolase n=1 Tax=Flavobacterium faecale TaxID=1355330 RepID=A0A2S1LH73_9FLAO|nr:hydrolase [Flavobacterium faecale]AWG23104.1 hydrolase [Flavobacterium faecale]
MGKHDIKIPLESVTLKGKLMIPPKATGIVVFCNCSSSCTTDPKNIQLAELLQKDNLGTLIFNLLTTTEAANCENKFNIDLLVGRLIKTTDWLLLNPANNELPIGYLGAKTGAAVAMRAAAYFGTDIKAVVSRSGRPDMVMDTLNQITAPTLLLVNGIDIPIISLNKIAYDNLVSEKEMKILPRTPAVMNEANKLKEAAEVAISWFQKYFGSKNTYSF